MFFLPWENSRLARTFLDGLPTLRNRIHQNTPTWIKRKDIYGPIQMEPDFFSYLYLQVFFEHSNIMTKASVQTWWV